MVHHQNRRSAIKLIKPNENHIDFEKNTTSLSLRQTCPKTSFPVTMNQLFFTRFSLQSMYQAAHTQNGVDGEQQRSGDT